MESSPVVFISGKRCWVHASGGSDRMFSFWVCVDAIVPPLGRLTLIGVSVGVPPWFPS